VKQERKKERETSHQMNLPRIPSGKAPRLCDTAPRAFAPERQPVEGGVPDIGKWKDTPVLGGEWTRSIDFNIKKIVTPDS